MRYRLGYCPQCQTKIMVENSLGVMKTFKPNFRQADLLFENGSKVRTIISSDCLATPNLTTILNAILAPGSEACDAATKTKIQAMGIPYAIIQASVYQGSNLGS